VTIFGIVALAARRGWVGYAEKPAGQCHIAGPIGIGEEAVVSNAVETVALNRGEFAPAVVSVYGDLAPM
jgi:hypothetical protein